MKNAIYILTSEMFKNPLAVNMVCQNDIKHMRVMNTLLRNFRQFDQSRRLQRGEQLAVAVPYREAMIGDGLGFFELRPKKGRDQFTWKKRRTNVLPAIFINFSPKVATTVRAFFPDDFRTKSIFFGIDKNRATLAADNVFRFVEAERAEIPNRAERFPLVCGHDALRRVLNHGQTMPVRDLQNGIHFATHPGVVNRYDRAGSRRYRGFDQAFVDVQRIRADIDEDRNTTP